jgi:iron complex transport system substrate-binding protein
MTDTIAVRPTVMSGEMHGGQWYAVGGRNSLAQLFRDAGADYVLGDNTETGGVYLDYEEHYAKAAHADYWRILNAYDGDFDYEVLRQSDSRYADFRAFRQRQVLYCNMRRTAYYEQAPMHPDQLLEDFVFAFHPNLMPKDYQPVFYHLLK